MLRFDIINHLIRKHNYQKYLEIGVQEAKTWDTIVCPYKVGVDPAPVHNRSGVLQMTSDAYFASTFQNWFDIIFIDGWHEYLQVVRDFKNSWRILNENGRIVMHDTIPLNKTYTQLEWSGDVWKAMLWILEEYDGRIGIETYNADHGITVIQKGDFLKQGRSHYKDLTWEQFDAHKNEILNIIPHENAATIQ